MSIEAVVFDVGNVLIEWQPERYYDARIGADRRKAMFSEVDLHLMNDRVDRGADFTETVYSWAEAHPSWRDEIRLWHDDWHKLASPAISECQSIARKLQAKSVPTFILSNIGVKTWDIACELYPVLHSFERAYVSGHMQMAKPDDEIYAAVEADCGISPDRLLFADDRADNIATAKRRGWQTHLFTDTKGWEGRLRSEGLLTPEDLV